MDSNKWIIGAFTVFFATLFSGVFLSDYLEHQVKMECVKQKGEYVGKTCVFLAFSAR